ncbi:MULTISPECIES: LysE family translocator [Kitasatospora]|uniref:LysE family translocator n=1 Tax=Kitasatospora TaxID=2063 RepID=UPI000C6FE15F|nr:LysE family translocator [Kitasatospora sp. GP30]MDH6139617.1 threonine/homoserine/homoserine lactone efflux protein [Kitasatospora sp. GP30]
MPTHLPVFLVTTWLLAMLPGVGQALMLRQALAGGLRTAWATIAGNATGLVLWSTAAAAGLSAILLANPRIYAAIRIIGGVLLVALGISTLYTRRTARGRAGEATPTAPSTEAGPRTGFWKGYLLGLSTNLGNPKAGVFAVSVLPQFVTTNGPVLLSSLALGGLWAMVNATWYVLFTFAVGRGRALVSRPAVQRGLSAVTGVVLIVVGAAVAAGA